MSAAPEKPAFPFTAVVGQQRFKTALILASIAPRLGGVLVSGPRGCAKSTLARGLADLHPESAEHFVTLPLGATEEQLIGSLDLQKALGEQSVEFRPGLLAKAHGGVLYIDEVNLLPDPLVDSLLDVAASGVNRVERDGISRRHAAEFLLVGTMNPDEGELRPQLLDRFGLSVELHSPTDIDERTAIMRQRVAYERDPEGFVASYTTEQAALRDRLDAARTAYPDVACPAELERQVAERCVAAQVDGVRADITWREAAAAHAAWDGREAVTEADLDAVAGLVLHHRRHDRDPESAGGSGNAGGGEGEGEGDGAGGSSEDTGDWGGMPPRTVSPAGPRALPREAAAEPPPTQPAAPCPAMPSGERGKGGREGRQPNHRAAPDERRVDWFRTLAATHAQGRGSHPTIRYRPSRRAPATLNCVLLDTSASTLDHRALAEAQAVILGLAERAYRARERLAILVFGNERIEWLLPPRRAPRDCAQYLHELPAGGGTPLRSALLTARDRLARLRRKEPGLRSRVYLLTDGLSREAVVDIDLDAPAWVIDTERARVPLGRCRGLAQQLGANYLPLERAAPVH